MDTGALTTDDMPLDIQSLSVAELFNPGVFSKLAPAFGLVPGVAADLDMVDESGESYDFRH